MCKRSKPRNLKKSELILVGVEKGIRVAPQKNVDDMIYENRARRIAPLQITVVLVGAGFCLSEMKNTHHAIFLRRYLVVVPALVTLGTNANLTH